jgi:predicted nuclease of restriction endonuclease-like (RecB) superfamily
MLTTEFDTVVGMIRETRTRAVTAVNSTLIDLYWKIGQFLSARIAAGAWGDGTVEQLAAHIRKTQSNATGFSKSNLWRMRQFYDTYADFPILATLLRELSWSHNLAILSRSKRDDEREFYLRTAVREKWTVRDLQRQLDGALFERVALSPVRMSVPMAEVHPDAATVFKGSYLVEFLQLPAGHDEADLQRGLVARLKEFLLELGCDFCFVGSQLPVAGGREGLRARPAVLPPRHVRPGGHRAEGGGVPARHARAVRVLP